MPSSNFTTPTIPEGDAPLEPNDIVDLLKGIPDSLILVGGQALAFWLGHYQISIPFETVVTADADFLGNLEDAKYIAALVSGLLVVPPKHARTAIVAQVRIPTSDPTKEKNIDIIHKLFATGGLRKSSELTSSARQRASRIEYAGVNEILILHPLDILTSRVANAAGLFGEKGDHVITQAKWAIAVVAKAFLTSSKDIKRIGAAMMEVQRLANSSAGRKLFKEHGVEVFDAIPCDEVVALHPELEIQVERMKNAMRGKRIADSASAENYRQAREIPRG